jgi:hypothetical protein
MGTDIDLYVEKRNADGKWELLFPSPEMQKQLHGEWAIKQDYGPGNLPGWAWYSGRNYELFSLLADVRNRFDLESPWAHRGIPKDSPLAKIDQEDPYQGRRIHTDGHSHSHVTLQELLDYNWDLGITKSGWMGGSEYKYWRDHDKKKWIGYCQGVGGGNTVKISNEEMDELFENGAFVGKDMPTERDPERKVWVLADPDDKRAIYTFCEWVEPMHQACRFFYERTLTGLKKVAADEGIDPKDIRLTYWFDC